MNYQHYYINGNPVPLPIGKVVCVGRNYLEHIHELNQPVPEQPLLFMKPSTALVALTQPLQLPRHGQCCHHELEIAVLIESILQQATPEQCQHSIIGYALALDLTLRDVQDRLKAKGHPWELAKSFDKACPISPFIPTDQISDPSLMEFKLTVNGRLRQHGKTQQMMTTIPLLLAYISNYFTLLPGDIVLTGTPAGVGELQSHDNLLLELDNRYQFSTMVS